MSHQEPSDLSPRPSVLYHRHLSIPERCKQALRILAGSDGVEQSPVGFPGVEQSPDPVVGESSETEGGAFDAFDEVVHGFGTAVGDPGVVPVDDLVMPTTQGAAQPGQLRWTVTVGEVVGEFTQIGVSELGAVDVIEAAQGLVGVPRQTDLALGIACGEQTAEFGVAVFAEPFMSRNEQPSYPIERVVFAAAVTQGVVLDPAPCLVNAVVAQTDHMERVSDLPGVR